MGARSLMTKVDPAARVVDTHSDPSGSVHYTMAPFTGKSDSWFRAPTPEHRMRPSLSRLAEI